MSDLWNMASHFGEYFGIEYSAERAAPFGRMIVGVNWQRMGFASASL